MANGVNGIKHLLARHHVVMDTKKWYGTVHVLCLNGEVVIALDRSEFSVPVTDVAVLLLLEMVGC